MKNYFEGWYFKQQTSAFSVAFIPAIHWDINGTAASLQIITEEGAHSIAFPIEAVQVFRKGPSIAIGNSRFSLDGIHLDVCNEAIAVKGDLRFGDLLHPRYDIMGPFKYVPFMECRHSVFSMKHAVYGTLKLNERTLDFAGGDGYIEGDRGRSFPKRYLWTQCGFDEGSVMLSVADIPFLGCCFTGIISIVVFRGCEHRIATYLGAKPTYIGSGIAAVRQGEYVLTAQLLDGTDEFLAAPVQGIMTRRIRESISCRVHYRFCKGDEVLFDFINDRASFENEYE